MYGHSGLELGVPLSLVGDMSVSAGISVRPPIGVTVSATVVDVDTVWVGCVRSSTYHE